MRPSPPWRIALARGGPRERLGQLAAQQGEFALDTAIGLLDVRPVLETGVETTIRGSATR